MNRRAFGFLPSGESIDAYTLASPRGASVEILTYGGIVRALRVPDRQGLLADVVLGFDTLADYVRPHPYFGALIGRIAGRLTGGRLTIGERTWQLARNDAGNHLHGGRTGFDRRVWQAVAFSQSDGAPALRLRYRSPDGEEGYPGTLEVTVTYTFTASHALVVESEATADQPTPLSLAQHSYFNLAGEGTGNIAGHEIQILAETVVPAADAAMTLSGERRSVVGEGNDFTSARRLGEALPRLFRAHGDLYLLPQPRSAVIARVYEPQSGRLLEVSSDEHCLQLYTGVALDGTLVGKSGVRYGPHAALCLECQGYPDAAGLPEWGDILVRPGQTQRHRTVYQFSTR